MPAVGKGRGAGFCSQVAQALRFACPLAHVLPFPSPPPLPMLPSFRPPPLAGPWSLEEPGGFDLSGERRAAGGAGKEKGEGGGGGELGKRKRVWWGKGWAEWFAEMEEVGVYDGDTL